MIEQYVHTWNNRIYTQQERMNGVHDKCIIALNNLPDQSHK